MKKTIFIVLIVIAAAMPVSAKSNLINVGYSVKNDLWGLDDVKLRSLSLNYTHVGGDVSGFYFQANPYWGLSIKSWDGSVSKLSDLGVSAFGANFIFGYGGDINLGDFGILLGGGLLVDSQYYGNSDTFIINILIGAGLGANFYYHPGAGNFFVNAGLNLDLHPFAYEFYDNGDSDHYTNSGMITLNFNIGIGWRTGSH